MNLNEAFAWLFIAMMTVNLGGAALIGVALFVRDIIDVSKRG